MILTISQSNKKNTAIVMSATSNMAFAMGTILLNLKEVSPNFADEVFIFSDGYISKKDKKIMNSIYPTTCIKYEPPISDEVLSQIPTGEYFSPLVLAKYECFKLLKEFKNVVFLDYDQVIKDNLNELTSNPELNCMMVATEDTKCNFEEPIFDYDMEKVGFGTNVFVVKDTLDYNKIYNFLYEKTIKYASKLKLPEQAIMSIMLQEFGIEPVTLGSYCIHPVFSSEELQEKAKVIHCFGPKKFWNGVDYEPWEKYYKQWLSLGGSEKNQPRKKKITFKKFLQLIFSVKNENSSKILTVFGIKLFFTKKKDENQWIIN